MVSRVFAAAVLGFVLTNTFGVLLTFVLPMAKLDAVITASLLSFLIFAVIVIWTFWVPNLWKVYGYLTAAIVLTSGLAWYLQGLEVAA